jgi:WD40 repeat protein
MSWHRGRLLLLIALPLALGGAVAGDPPPAKERGPRPADAPAAARTFRQLGQLRAGLAFQAREEEREPLKAAHLYLQAAQAFHRAGDDEFRKALVAGALAARPLRATWVHEERPVAMALLPGEKQVLTCGAGGDFHVWDAATGRELRSFQARPMHGPFHEAVFNRDRSRMLLWDWSTAQLWDVGRGKRLQGWKPDPMPIRAAFLPGDRYVLTWGVQPPIRLWDVQTGKELRNFPKGVGNWQSPAVSPDGTRLLTPEEKRVSLWEVTRDRPLHTFPAGSKDDHLDAAFSPDGKRVAVFGYADNSARLFDAATGRQLKLFFDERPRRRPTLVTGVAFSPDGRRLLAWGEDGRARLWDVAEAERLYVFPADDKAGARFTADGRGVLTLGDPSVLWDADDGRPLGRLGAASAAAFTRDGRHVLLSGHRAELWDLTGVQLVRTFGAGDTAVEAALRPDEAILLVRSFGESGGAVRLWDLRQPDPSRSAPEAAPPPLRVFRHPDAVLSASLDRDEARLLTADAGGTAQLWDVAKGERLRSFAQGRGLRGAAFDPGQARVLTWGEGGTARLWEAKTGQEVRTLKHPAGLRGAAFGPDGSHLLTWDADYTARWWDLARDEPRHAFEHGRDLFGARLDRKGSRALTWGLDGAARVWDLDSGRLVTALAHGGPVIGAAFAADEGRVWTWAGDGFRAWDVRTGKELRHLPVKGGVAAALPSRDDKRFLMRNAQGLVQYWAAGSGKALATFTHVFNVYGYYESVSAGVFSPDETRALTWAGDGSVHVWDLATGLKLQTFRHPKAVGGAAFTHDGSRVLTWGADGTARLWEVDAPKALAPDEQLLELEARSGVRVDEHGKLLELSYKEWQDRRRRWDAGPGKGQNK